jgi:hypothetical protein
MTLSPSNRAVLETLYPYALQGVAGEDLDDLLDRWFADDHFDDNPAYTWTNESNDE